MTEQPPFYQVQKQTAIAKAQDERDLLLRECHQLLYKVSRRPCSIKLLNGVRDQLQLFAGYKANRRR